MSLAKRIGKGVSGAMLGAFIVPAIGLLGHVIGNHFYPQPMEQVPSDLLLVPFGAFLGFMAGFIGAATARDVGMSGPAGIVLLVGLLYGGCNYDYAKGRAIPAGILVDFDPEPASAHRCGAACPPGTEWTVEGTVRVRAIRVEGLITGMRIWSSEMPPKRTNTITIDPSLARFRGPTVLFGERDIPGDPQLKPNAVRLFPIKYSYQNRGAESAREIIVTVYFTGSNGRQDSNGRAWHVR